MQYEPKWKAERNGKWKLARSRKTRMDGFFGDQFLHPKKHGLNLHPWSLTWNLKMAPRGKGDEPNLETIMFRFHVKLWGCKCEHLEEFFGRPERFWGSQCWSVWECTWQVGGWTTGWKLLKHRRQVESLPHVFIWVKNFWTIWVKQQNTCATLLFCFVCWVRKIRTTKTWNDQFLEVWTCTSHIWTAMKKSSRQGPNFALVWRESFFQESSKDQPLRLVTWTFRQTCASCNQLRKKAVFHSTGRHLSHWSDLSINYPHI